MIKYLHVLDYIIRLITILSTILHNFLNTAFYQLVAASSLSFTYFQELFRLTEYQRMPQLSKIRLQIIWH